MNFNEQAAYIGSLDQLFLVKEYTMLGGRKDGVRGIDISNGAGLDITVLPGRCLDVLNVRFKGKNLNYLTASGVANAAYYECDDWLRTFAAGFLTTCGLTNIGVPCEDAFGRAPMHGRISATPADNVTVETSMVGGVPVAVISGVMREAELFGCNMELRRTITCRYGNNEIELTDEVRNAGYRTAPHMILYHFNIGYPLLSEGARLNINHHSIKPRNEYAAKHLEQWNVVTPPISGIDEMCYYHDIKADGSGMATVGVSNPGEAMSLSISFDKNVLDHFVQWKMLGKGEYVMGLEPCNATIDGRDDALKNGSLKMLEPGESVTYRFNISVSEIA